jgi:hypothetical protein
MHAVAGVVQGLAVAAVGAILGFLIGGAIGAVIGAVLLGLFAIPYGRAVTLGKMYAGNALGVWRAILDATWSSLNTAAAALYYGIHRLTGNTHNLARTEGSGAVWLDRGVVTKYATTIGTVKAGSNDRIDRHEMIHVFQARLFGPLYLPLVGLNYVIATILPYWLLYRHRPITGFGSYFEDGVYPNVWNELWAYRATAPATTATAAPTAPAV